MRRMARFGSAAESPEAASPSVALILCLALGLTLTQGCARSEPPHPVDGASPAAAKQQLPFHSEAGQASVTAASNPGILPDPKTGLPFKASRAQVLPAGTLLTVQLDQSLSAAKVHPGDAFTASLASPLVVNGATVLERGAEVTGLVQAAQSRRGSGYVQLTLSAITVEGVPRALQTSNLFARGTVRHLQVSSSGTASGNSSTRALGSSRIPKGRRLTFRLTAPLTLDEPTSTAKRASAQ